MDLSDADLFGANLCEADLTDVSLVRADLTNANFTEAILIRTNLAGANLMETNFTEAKIVDLNFSDMDITGANLSGIDLSKEQMFSFTVRNIASLEELKHLWQLEHHILGNSALDYTRLEEWFRAYKHGIKTLYYQNKIIVGTISLFPLSRETALNLENRICQGKFEESELEVASVEDSFLKRCKGFKYWYCGAVYLNESLRVKGLSRGYLTYLMTEAVRLWILEENKFIDKSDKVTLYAVAIYENCTDVRKQVSKMLNKFGFERQPGHTADHWPLYKVSKPFEQLAQELNQHLSWPGV